MIPVPPAPPSAAEVTEQLVAEFGALLSPSVVQRVVLTVSDHLGGETGEPAPTETVARVAHARLNALRLELLG